MTSVSWFGDTGLHFPCPKCVEKQNQEAPVICKTLMMKCPHHQYSDASNQQYKTIMFRIEKFTGCAATVILFISIDYKMKWGFGNFMVY